MKKIIALNLKAYLESAGANGAKLAQAAEEFAKGASAFDVVVCPQAPQLGLLTSRLRHARVFAQHLDDVEAGAKTGWISPVGVKESGVEGTLVNHSERRLPKAAVAGVVEKCGKLGLQSIVCAESVSEALELAALSPWAVAYEPPQLIGSGVSVSSAQPEIVGEFVSKMQARAKGVIPIVGAGVSSAADVKKCFELGAQGVLLASAFVKAKDPAGFLEAMK